MEVQVVHQCLDLCKNMDLLLCKMDRPILSQILSHGIRRLICYILNNQQEWVIHIAMTHLILESVNLMMILQLKIISMYFFNGFKNIQAFRIKNYIYQENRTLEYTCHIYWIRLLNIICSIKMILLHSVSTCKE